MNAPGMLSLTGSTVKRPSFRVAVYTPLPSSSFPEITFSALTSIRTLNLANTSELNNSLVLATSDFFPDHLSLPIASHHFFPVTTHRHQNR
jgi:hypothetical protein